MGTRFEIKVGESYTGGIIEVAAAIPTDPTAAGTIGLFIGNLVPYDNATSTNLVITAIAQARAALKESLTNEGQQNVLDKYNVRDPIDSVKQVSNDIALATEEHIWLGFEGTILESSKSHLLNTAIEVLTKAYKKRIGVGVGLP